VPTYASAAYGCALALSQQTTGEVRATFYSRLSQYGPHAAPCTCVGPFPHGPGVCPSAFPARFPSVPTSGFDHGGPSIPHSGARSAGDSVYDKSLTGEPTLPARTANQYLAKYCSRFAPVKLVHRSEIYHQVAKRGVKVLGRVLRGSLVSTKLKKAKKRSEDSIKGLGGRCARTRPSFHLSVWSPFGMCPTLMLSLYDLTLYLPAREGEGGRKRESFIRRERERQFIRNFQ